MLVCLWLESVVNDVFLKLSSQIPAGLLRLISHVKLLEQLFSISTTKMIPYASISSATHSSSFTLSHRFRILLYLELVTCLCCSSK